MIDYSKLNDTTREDFAELTGLYARHFLAWVEAAPSRKTKPLAKTFPQWFMSHGPTGFKTDEDRRVFRGGVLYVAEGIARAEA